MAAPKERYYTKIVETLVDYNDRNNAPFFDEKLLQAVIKVMAETEEEELNSKLNANNVTMDNLCQSPVTTNTQGEVSNVTNERQISSDIMAETIKVFN